MRTFVLLIGCFLIADFGFAQDDYRYQDRMVGHQYVQDSFRLRTQQRPNSYQRVASRPRVDEYNSAPSADYYPEMQRPSPRQGRYVAQQTRSTSYVSGGQSNWQTWNGYDPGNIPYVTGDIFGVSRHELCDEWEGHCECLELTSSRSNCRCDYPRCNQRGQCYGAASGCQDCNYAGDQSYFESGSRTPVSDYFHANRRR